MSIDSISEENTLNILLESEMQTEVLPITGDLEILALEAVSEIKAAEDDIIELSKVDAKKMAKEMREYRREVVALKQKSTYFRDRHPRI